MKKLILSILTIILALPLVGNPIDETTAKQLAQNFWKENNIMGVRGDKIFKKRMDDAKFANVAPQCGYSEFFIFNNENGKGFVIIAADDCVTPILGYSYDNNFVAENLPPNLKGWLDGYAEQIRMAVEMRVTATEEIRADWECLRRRKNLPIKSETAVSPLIATTWSQGQYYNMLCPEDINGPDGHALTGCVATAMAQILKYWEYPNDAHRVVWHEYDHPVYGILGANYSYAGGSYYWNYMPTQLTYSSSTYQKQAVASLMYHCGVSVEMNYGPDVSLAYSTAAEIAFRAFFDYNDATLKMKSSYTDTQWINLLKNELDDGRPIFYAGSGPDGGHAFVCDGYNANNYFHFNWGYSGGGDGNFSINNLNPTVNGHQFNFTSGQNAIIGIEPGGTNNYHLLGLNADIEVNGDNFMIFPYIPIQEITTEIYNWGNVAFNGSLCAVVYDGEGQYVAESEFINNCQISPMQSSGQLSFTFSESLNILSCKAYVGIYSIENNEPTLVSAYGRHANPDSFYDYSIIYNMDDRGLLVLYSDIEYLPTSIVQFSEINVTADIYNDGIDPFNGDYAAALYSINGELLQILSILHEGNGLQPGYHYTSPLSFYCPSVNVPSGTYYLTIIHKSDGSDIWYPLYNGPTCDNPEHVNPIRVNVVSPVTYTINAAANPSNGGTVSFDYDFDDGTMMGWTSIDADGDGYNWRTGTEMMGTGYGHNGSNDLLLSQSYDNEYGVLYPDNYLVSPQVVLGGSISFWACAQDNAYSSEHFGVAISTTSNTNANSFTTIQEWTMTAKGEGRHSNHSRDGISRTQGNWYQYTVDLSAFSGQTGYIAIRHFNCSDMFYLDIDDVSINTIGGNTYYQGQTCTVHATPNSGYTFVNWTENGTQVSTNANYTFTVTGNRNLVANFQAQPQQYTINVSANPSNSGSVSGGGNYQQGQTCTVSATANSGYTFVNWTENGTQVSTNSNYTFTITSNRNLVAHFTAQNYVITAIADPTAGGTVTGSGGYNYGESCTLTATANAGYTFINWTKNGSQVSSNPTYTFTVTETATYVAHFSIQSYSVTTSSSPSNGGTTTGGGIYNYGQTCTVTASAANGYAFTNWTENGTQISTNANYSFTVTSNRNLTANFAQSTHTIQATAGANGIITPSGTITVAHGANQSFSMIPDDGYEVQDVYIDGNPVGPMTSYTFTNVTADHYIHVTFTNLVGIKENNDFATVIYPNPTTGIVNIKCNEATHVNVFNAFGQLLLTQSTNGNDQETIDISNLPNGIYLIQMIGESVTSTKQIIKIQ